MKKLVIGLVLIILLVSASVSAASGDIIGNIYSTDILTYVNGKPIDGYNIGGKTVVIAEDLQGYGFGHEYDDTTRTLSIKSYFHDGLEEYAEIPRGKTGKTVGSVYDTDIKVLFNGMDIKGYNIGGRTAICIEDMGELTGSTNADYGYSKYLGKHTWNPHERTLSFESYKGNLEKILGISRVYHEFKDNIIYTYSDEYCAKSEICPNADSELSELYVYSESFNKSVISPLYISVNDKLTEIGVAVNNPNNKYNEAIMYITDAEKTRELIKTAKQPRKTHDEAVAYFSKVCKVIETMENENYTVMRVEDKNKKLLFVYINKNGGFVVDDFFSEYGDREVKMWFEKKSSDSESDKVAHSVYPFGGTHGVTSMSYATDLDEYDYE